MTSLMTSYGCDECKKYAYSPTFACFHLVYVTVNFIIEDENSYVQTLKEFWRRISPAFVMCAQDFARKFEPISSKYPKISFQSFIKAHVEFSVQLQLHTHKKLHASKMFCLFFLNLQWRVPQRRWTLSSSFVQKFPTLPFQAGPTRYMYIYILRIFFIFWQF